MPIDPNRVKALFVAALDLPAGERTLFVARECGADAALRTRLDELLAAHDGAATVDAAPGTAAYDPDATRTADVQPLGEVGEVVGGKYHLIDEVGSGGMGSVWRAEQRVPVKRSVAVKLIKAGMDSKAVLARFDAERQALAVMDHPNIAKVLDGGVTADGRPYFVMELVKGTPITTFADARKLTPRQRLELFVPVCSAIQHAHMKGVIHRDIKPANVLVALYDDKAVPKVIDFGIAKATGAALTEHTLHTGLGAVVGTPEYMSPEQASLNNLDVDTRSDVYALGVLLYELLTGSPPFTRRELEVKGLLELLRVVREEEPPRPSVKLSTAAARPSIAASRGTEPTALGKLLRSELDWLVMKALEKDRDRRYDSAISFAADVQRYLAGEAVQAVPPSLGYRVRKNRGLVITSGLVAASLVAGSGVATWQAIRADQAAERARQEEAKTKDALAQSERNREQAEINLVHSYLRPIGFNTAGPDQVELIALDEVAQLEDDRIKLLFLREAMTDPGRAVRVTRRAERVIQAAVGTSLRRREAALQLTGEKQRDVTADPRVRLCACWLAIELGSEDLPAFGECFDSLAVGMVSSGSEFIPGLSWKTPAARTSALLDALTAAVGKTADWGVLDAVANELTALSPRLSPAAAERCWDALVRALGRSANDHLGGVVPGCLLALVPRLDPSSVQIKLAQAVDAFLVALRVTKDDSVVRRTGDVLTAFAPALDPVAAGRAADVLVTLFEKTTDHSTLSAVQNGLSALVPRLDRPTAIRISDSLFAIFHRLGNGTVRFEVANTLASLAPHLDPVTVIGRFDGLVQELRKPSDFGLDGHAYRMLSILARRLDPAKADHVTDIVIGSLVPPVNPVALWTIHAVLPAVARFDQGKAVQVADALEKVLRESSDEELLRAACSTLEGLALHIDNKTAARGWEALVSVFARTRDDGTRRHVADGLIALAPKLDPDSASKGFDDLMPFIGRAPVEEGILGRVDVTGECLSGLAPRLTAQATDRAVGTLLSVPDKLADERALHSLAVTLAAFAPRLDAAKVGPVADAVVNIFHKTTDPYALNNANLAVAALAPRLDSQMAGRCFVRLIDVAGRTNWSGPRPSALSSLAPRLDQPTAGKCFQTLAGVLKSTTDPDKQLATKTALIALAPLLGRVSVSEAADALTASLFGKNESGTLALNEAMFEVLVELIPRLEPSASAKVTDVVAAKLSELGALPQIRRATLRLFRGTVRLSHSQRLSLARRIALPVSDSDRISTFPGETALSEELISDWGHFDELFVGVTSTSLLREMLSDPICVGNLQSAVLARLEQLAYPEPAQAAVFAGLAADPLRALTLPAVQKADDDHRQQTRRFRTVSDAAKWLAEHHPETDLDSPYHKVPPVK